MAKRTKQQRGEVALRDRLKSIPQEVKDACIEVYSEEMPALGRPRRNIDPLQVYEMARIHCTWEEMASALLVSPDTLETHFSGIVNLARSEGKKGLRRKMFETAEQGNTSMMIWLSKNHLGMKDAEPTQQQTQINFNVNVNEVPK
jgi:hypothetical protein